MTANPAPQLDSAARAALARAYAVLLRLADEKPAASKGLTTQPPATGERELIPPSTRPGATGRGGGV